MPPTWCPCAATLQAPAALGPASVLGSGEDAQKSAPPGRVDEHTLPTPQDLRRTRPGLESQSRILRGMQALLAGPTRSLKGLLRRSRMMLEKPSEHAAPQAESQGWSFDV